MGVGAEGHKGPAALRAGFKGCSAFKNPVLCCPDPRKCHKHLCASTIGDSAGILEAEWKLCEQSRGAQLMIFGSRRCL